MSEETNEELPKYDAQQIEAEMIKAAENRAVDPAESAAMVYSMYKPEVSKRLSMLSSKQMRRLLKNLIEYPLNEKEMSTHSVLEKEFFMLADAMLQSKFIMMQQTYMESAEQLVAAQDELLFGKEAKQD